MTYFVLMNLLTERTVLDLAQANTDQSIAYTVRRMTVDVKGNAVVTRIGGCRTEIHRKSIPTPPVTLLVTICVPGKKKARIEGVITDQ